MPDAEPVSPLLDSLIVPVRGQLAPDERLDDSGPVVRGDLVGLLRALTRLCLQARRKVEGLALLPALHGLRPQLVDVGLPHGEDILGADVLAHIHRPEAPVARVALEIAALVGGGPEYALPGHLDALAPVGRAELIALLGKEMLEGLVGVLLHGHQLAQLDEPPALHLLHGGLVTYIAA